MYICILNSVPQKFLIKHINAVWVRLNSMSSGIK